MEEEKGQETAAFTLKSGTDKFVSRSQEVFAGLGVLEDKHSAFLKATESSRARDDKGLLKEDPKDEDDEFTRAMRDRHRRDQDVHERSRLSRTQDSDYERRSHSRSSDRESNRSNSDRQDRDRDVAFRRPNRPPYRGGRQPIPDFKKHPEKYTCYSLGDVSEQDMSDRACKQAAFAFLEERRLEREKEERRMAGLPEEEPKFDTSSAACSQGLITFSRPKHKKSTDESHQSAETMGNNAATTKHHSSKNSADETGSAEQASAEDDEGNEERRVDTDSDKGPSTFRARKNVRRHIRKKDSDDEED